MLEKIIRRQVYYIASVVFIVMGIAYFITCIHHPFIGLEIENIDGQWVVTSSDPNGEGVKSGIHVGDQILKINDQDTGKYRLIQKWGEAEGASTIEFHRAGQESDTIISIQEIPALLTLINDSPMIILGFVFWLIGFMTWFKRSFLVQARTLFWLNWLIGLAFVLAHASSRDLMFARELECTTLSLIPMVLISFISIFPINNKNRINREGSRITLFIFVMILCLSVLQSVDVGHHFNLIRKLLLANMIIGILFALWNLSISIRLSKDKPARNQTAIILLGIVVGFLPIILLTAIPIIFNHQPLVYAQVSVLFIASIPISLYYVIVNKYLTDCHRLFRTATTQFIVGIIISSIITFVLYSLRIVQTLNIEIYLALLFLTILLIICINSGCVVITKLLEKFEVLKDSRGYKPRIIELNENITSMFSENGALAELVRSLGLEGAFIIIENAQKGCLKKAVGRYHKKQIEQTALENFFHNQKSALEVKILPDYFPAGIYVPFVSHDFHCGIFFGHRCSRIKFEQTELSFLSLFGAQLANELIMSLVISELTTEINFLTKNYLKSDRKNQQLQSITNSLFQNLEQTKKLISNEICASPLQSGLDLCRWLKYLEEESPPSDKKKKTIHHMRDLVENLNYELNLIANDLRPQILNDLGLLSAIELQCQQIMHKELSLIFMETTGISHENRFNEKIELTAYRFLQEGLMNSVRHSGSNKQRVRIVLNQSKLELKVSDSGRGFDTSQLENWLLTGAHFGIVSLKEQIESLGGELQINSVIHRGTTLKATIPVA